MTQSFNPNQLTPSFAAGPAPSLADIASGLGPLGAPATDSNQLFEALLGLSWRDIGIPYAEIATEVRQDLVIHKFADRNGAHVEGTGRHPLQFTARVPFLNGIDAGSNESWQRPLYPFVRDNLLRAVLQVGSGPLQHPELGTITCKCEVMRWFLRAEVRSGVWAELVWIESDDTGLELDANLSAPSPLAEMQASAADLDAYMTDLAPPLPSVANGGLPTFTSSFEDDVFAVRGVVDTPTLLQKQYAGRLDNLIYQASALQYSMQQAKSALTWPVVAACERMKAACNDQKATQLTTGRRIGIFEVQKDSTLAQVATSIAASVADIMLLNPAYLASPIVRKHTQVRYYLAAA